MRPPSDLPSRNEVRMLVEGGWFEARYPDAGRVLRHFAEGGFVDREAIDYEAALVQARKDGADEPWKVSLVVDAALDREIELDDYERVILDRALDRMEPKGNTG